MADLFVVLLLEVVGHRDCGSSLTLLELAGRWTHVKSNIGYLVGLMVSIASHDDSTFEFIHNSFVEFSSFWRLVCVTGSPLGEPIHLLVDELVTVIDRKILRYVVNDKIETSLEYPRRSEESWPSLDRIVKDLGLGAHKESWVSSNLAKI